MRKPKLNVIPQVGTFVVPWFEGGEVDVRRTGHTSAIDPVVVDFIESKKQKMMDARDAAIKRSNGVVSAIKDDEVYGKAIRSIVEEAQDKEPEMLERRACALVASWRGEGFEKKELPKDGKSGKDSGLVYKVFFKPLDVEDEGTIPRFVHAESGTFVRFDTKTYDELCEFVIDMDEACQQEKDLVRSENGVIPVQRIRDLLSAPTKGESDTADYLLLRKSLIEITNGSAWVEPDSSAIQKRQDDIQKKRTIAYHEALEVKGFKEVPCYGMNQRSAWAEWISNKADEVELKFQRSRGVLQRAT